MRSRVSPKSRTISSQDPPRVTVRTLYFQTRPHAKVAGRCGPRGALQPRTPREHLARRALDGDWMMTEGPEARAHAWVPPWLHRGACTCQGHGNRANLETTRVLPLFTQGDRLRANQPRVSRALVTSESHLQLWTKSDRATLPVRSRLTTRWLRRKPRRR